MLLTGADKEGKAANGRTTANGHADIKAQSQEGLIIRPLLPEQTNKLYLAVKREEVCLGAWHCMLDRHMHAAHSSALEQVRQWDARLAELSKHNGPNVGKHVPAHALDALGCSVAYPPEMLDRC